eukprot:GILJ01008012.1.p1 GENE.GILJ01008012.1~~GILJ01008012.1.p1  ORF type:complete len:171 (-),score=13.63 GILJ01008012.1:384-896(-)
MTALLEQLPAIHPEFVDVVYVSGRAEDGACVNHLLTAPKERFKNPLSFLVSALYVHLSTPFPFEEEYANDMVADINGRRFHFTGANELDEFENAVVHALRDLNRQERLKFSSELSFTREAFEILQHLTDLRRIVHFSLSENDYELFESSRCSAYWLRTSSLTFQRDRKRA